MTLLQIDFPSHGPWGEDLTKMASDLAHHLFAGTHAEAPRRICLGQFPFQTLRVRRYLPER